MSFKRVPVRYGHTPGYTHCAYSQDGSKFFTCGSDGDVRIWANAEDDDPFTQCVGESAMCVVQYDQRILVSTDLNTVQAYTYPECARDGTEFHFTGTVTTIKLNETYMAAGSENMEIKFKLLDNLNETYELLGHEGIILHIDISPDDMLASSSGDGTIKIWDLTRKELIKTITGLDKVKAFNSAVSYATPSFEPVNGAFLAYPLDKEIIILDTSTFAKAFVLRDQQVASKFTTCKFSLCGRYLAAGTRDGEISLWDVAKKTCFKGDTKGLDVYGITSISWNPINNGELIYCDNRGQLGFINWDIASLTKEYPSITKDIAAINGESEDFDDYDFPFVEDPTAKEDEDNENCVSLEKLKSETLNLNVLDESFDGIHGIDENSHSNKNEKIVRTESRSSEMLIPQKIYSIQPAFQPSSTPDYLENRYMCWNHVGLIRLHKSDHKSTIHIEFHDVSINNELILDNNRDHTIASLSSTVVALSGETPSKLTCIVFSKGSSREWSVDLPNCESVLAVTATSKLVALVTDARYLRIFGVMGTQREVISIPGPVVALAGHEDKLLVAYHSAAATEEQFINVLLIQAVSLTLRARDVRLPLTPNSKLTWIGYSDCGSAVSYDSMGMLRMYNTKSNLWYPICDTQLHVKGASDNFFIIEVSEATQTLRAILCRGSCYPLTHPRPIVNELPLQLNFCDIEEEKSCLEESLVRWSTFDVHNAEKNIKESAIKLFALSCRSEMEGRARELIEMLASPQLVPLAIKYASKLGRMHLAEKLSDLLPVPEQQETVQDSIEREVFGSQEEHHFGLTESTFCSPVITKLESKKDTPTIKLKPILECLSKKKNVLKPLKPLANSKSANLLSHLTNKVIGLGLPTNKSGNNLNTMEKAPENNEILSQDLFGSMENLENDTNKTSTSDLKMTCGEWFQLNRRGLEIEFPDLSMAELTKIGTQRFKEIKRSAKVSNNDAEVDLQSPSTSNGVKRKRDEVDKMPSSITKLAKFYYSK